MTADPVFLPLRLLLAACALTASIIPSNATTYHLDSTSGKDASDGQSPATAWRSLAKASATTFQPGDRLLLKAGRTWTGQLHPKGSGTAADRLELNRYGEGTKPVIHGGGLNSGAVLLEDQQYWTIRNLEITNNGTTAPRKQGILIRNNCAGTLSGIEVRDCDIHDITGVMPEYADDKESGGIVFQITASNLTVPSKWTHVVIADNTIRNVNRSGILMKSMWINKPQDPNSNWPGHGTYLPSTNILIAGNTIENVGGDGIIPWCVGDSVVEHNFVRASNNQNLRQAHAGIWPYFCENVIFQFNEVCETKTKEDGMAFDFDNSNQNCIYQYNYSHDNEGGFLNMCCDGNANGNIARYNVSQNDGCLAGSRVFLVHGDGNHGYQIYNNTIYVKNGNPEMFHQGASSNGSDIMFRNNIFINLGSGPFVAPKGCAFDGNLYFGNGHIAADPHKILRDSKLVNAGSGGKGLASLNGYKLQSDSPALDAGLIISSNGGRDFWGNPVAAATAPHLGAGSATPAVGPRDPRMDWWREARFGMFIHWGLYAVPAGIYNGRDQGSYGEWIMKGGKIPVADYAKFAGQFNPVKFNADEWADFAKEAGMKYLVITAKHHDGFCMFKTNVDDFNIVDATPFKRDPVKELAEACRKRGIKFGVYYSQAQDWSHPGGGIISNEKPWDKAQEGDYDQYLREVSIPQVRELLKDVDPAVLWFDTPLDMKPERTQEFLDVLKPYPALIYNNRLGNGVSGDTETPEQEIPLRATPGRNWETCMTLNGTWGYKSNDQNYKSTTTLLHNLIDIASKGGNYLLNVGPTAEGVIPKPQTDRLKELGAWLKVNGESIYGTSAGLFAQAPAWGRMTCRPGKIYLHVFNWPKEGKLLLPLPNKVLTAKLLANPGESLKTVVTAEGVEIRLPAAAPDAIASVIALDIEGELAPIPAPPVAQAADASLTLLAAAADIHGSTIKIAGGGEPNIDCWTDIKDSVTWEANITQPGEFEVIFNLACAPGSDGGEFTFSVGNAKLAGKTTATADWKDYKSLPFGRIRIDQPGTVSVGLTSTRKPGLGVMNLRSITLKPSAATPK